MLKVDDKEIVLLMVALENYAQRMAHMADQERLYEKGGNPEYWQHQEDEVRALLKKVEDCPPKG